MTVGQNPDAAGLTDGQDRRRRRQNIERNDKIMMTRVERHLANSIVYLCTLLADRPVHRVLTPIGARADDAASAHGFTAVGARDLNVFDAHIGGFVPSAQQNLLRIRILPFTT
jgi:hypothetical protein